LDTWNGQTTLTRERNTTAGSLRVDETGLLTRGIEHLSRDKLLRHTSCGRGLLHTDLVSCLDASFQLALSNILPLCQSDIEWLAIDHTLVHLSDGFGGLIRVVEADEAEALALT
jgi:hypothetical protein